ncbi:MAG: hypothetical protein JNL85_02575 [Rubrivivax sp.]|nr:hypothetical protein [Rubrivivax sp.]
MSARPAIAFAADAVVDRRRSAAAAGAALPPPANQGASGDLLRGRLMQRSLQALLDRVQGSRAALPHLAALEVALIEHGAAAVPAISPKGLTKIHQQLRILPLEAGDGPIQDLLALVHRSLRQQAREQQTHQLSPHDPQSTVVISEGSESDFMNALAEARSGGGH